MNWVQQISNFLHVDFHVADFDGVFNIHRTCGYTGKDLFDNARYDTLGELILNTRTHHSV